MKKGMIAFTTNGGLERGQDDNAWKEDILHEEIEKYFTLILGSTGSGKSTGCVYPFYGNEKDANRKALRAMLLNGRKRVKK